MSKSLAARFRAVPIQWLVGAIAAIGLAVSACFGGLAQAHPSESNTIAANQLIKGEPWDVTVVVGRILPSQTGLKTEKAGDRWVVVIATVDVTSDDSRGDMSSILRVHGVSGLTSAAPQRILLSRDGTDVRYLNPDMPERVGFCWEQAASAPVPTSLDVDVYNETLRANSLDGDGSAGVKEWLDPTVVATVHATVQDLRT